MRKPELIQQQIRHLDSLTEKTRRAALQYPNDYALQILLDQDEYNKQQLVEELRQSVIEHRSHVVSYIFKIRQGEGMSLDKLLSGLTAFRNLVDKISQTISGDNIPLGFGTVFEGSFGVMLTTPHDGQLLETNYERTFAMVFDTLEGLSADNADVKQIIDINLKNDRHTTKKFSKLFADIIDLDRPVAISWNNVHGERRSLDLSVEKAKWLHEHVIAHNDKPSETLNLVGVIKGMSLVSNKIEFEHVEDGKKKPQITRATFSQELFDQVSANFNKKVKVTILKEYIYNDETDQETIVKTLQTIG